MPDFYDVSVYLPEAKAIAWDTCHKIYLLMDDQQVEAMRGYGYGDENDPDSLITKDQMTSQQMLDTVKKWYDESCFLRFVEAVETVEEGKDPNEGFTTLIEQGASDDEECDNCLEMGCAGACEDFVVEEEDDEEEEEEDD